ncbi:MAG: hypothetical protein LBR26_01845 [Prevotella sp.]|nr:hypothetical protein [Prevotella sp.]
MERSATYGQVYVLSTASPSFGVASRYAERGHDGKSRRDDTLLTVGGAKRNLRNGGVPLPRSA